MANELTEAAATAYQDIFDNNHGMRDDLVGFWTKSAEFWKDEPGVVGFELINEPFAGNVYKDPLLFLPAVAGSLNLQPFYDVLGKAIRAIDQNHMIMYEPVTWGMIFNGKIVGSGINHPPGGAQYANKSAFSYHYYCASFVPGYDGHPKLRSLICDDLVGPLVFKAVDEHVAQVKGASILSEFGGCTLNNATGMQECVKVTAHADTHWQSWTDYSYAQVENLQVSDVWTNVYSRTFARAIAGQPLNTTFDVNTKKFSLCYKPDTGIKQPTEVFFNPSQYKNGLHITASAGLTYTFPGGISGVNNSLAVHSSTEVDSCLYIS